MQAGNNFSCKLGNTESTMSFGYTSRDFSDLRGRASDVTIYVKIILSKTCNTTVRLTTNNYVIGFTDFYTYSSKSGCDFHEPS